MRRNSTQHPIPPELNVRAALASKVWPAFHSLGEGRLPKNLRRNIGIRIEALCEDLQGDVKKLKGQPPRYRLRVGGHRILFTLAGGAIEVYAVKCRKDAYE